MYHPHIFSRGVPGCRKGFVTFPTPAYIYKQLGLFSSGVSIGSADPSVSAGAESTTGPEKIPRTQSTALCADLLPFADRRACSIGRGRWLLGILWKIGNSPTLHLEQRPKYCHWPTDKSRGPPKKPDSLVCPSGAETGVFTAQRGPVPCVNQGKNSGLPLKTAQKLVVISLCCWGGLVWTAKNSNQTFCSPLKLSRPKK